MYQSNTNQKLSPSSFQGNGAELTIIFAPSLMLSFYKLK
jgi:hypothetical protein